MTDKKQPGAKGKRKPSPAPIMTVTYHGQPSGAVIAAALYELLVKKGGKT